MTVWNHITDQDAGYAFSLSDAVVALEEANPGVLVPLDHGRMVMASDYSGQHKNASHESYSFVVTSEEDLRCWLPALRGFRDTWLPDGRTLSFKKLNEPVRWRAVPAFLSTVGKLTANLITVMVAREVGSFFGGDHRELVSAFPDCFCDSTKPGTAEKMLRHATFVALLTAALRREDQEMLWVSDHDETLDSHDRREAFARLATYLTYGLSRWRQPAATWFGTTELDAAPDWAEDLAAVADYAAGAYCKMSEQLPRFFGVRNSRISMSPKGLDRRVLAFADWLAAGPSHLRHVLLRLEVDTTDSARASAQVLSGNGLRSSKLDLRGGRSGGSGVRGG